MKRREFLKAATASLVASAIAQRAFAMARSGGWLGVNEVQASDQPATGSRRQQIAMLVYPQFAALDLVGPFDTFAVATEIASSRKNGRAYDLVTVGLKSKAVVAESGMRFHPGWRGCAKAPGRTCCGSRAFST